MAAESNGQEKTEQPTGKRRKDARKEGNVFQSKEICTVVIVFGVFWMVRIMLPYIYGTIRQYLIWIFSSLSGEPAEILSLHLAILTFIAFAKCGLPLLLFALLLGILSHGVQTRFNVSFKPIRPKFSKLNPIKGMKKFFSLKNIIELVKSLVKIALLLSLLYNVVKGDIQEISRMVDIPLFDSAVMMLKMIFNLVTRVCIAFTVIAFFDYLYQRWEYERDLKMTKQEVKDEYKQTEGDPKVKSRIRRVQQQMAMSRMMQRIPEADVIIRNPTHFAVALKYDPDKNAAPLVLAKGQDLVALRIIKAGEEHGIFIIENRPLARALYASCDIGREIPAEFYGAVAEILVQLYRASNREDMLR